LAPWEDCDDGNNNDDDDCPATCRAATCGNGQLDAGEGCDDGNDNNFDGCLSNCHAARCGDGIIRRDIPLGEAGFERCDDGNNLAGDGCAADCALLETCGNGQLDAGEECDDGNRDGFDGCDPLCFREGQFESEPNDTWQMADPFHPGMLTAGIRNDVNEIDWFVFTLPEVANITLETRPQAGGVNGDTRMWLYRAGEPPVQAAYDDDGGAGLYSRITQDNLAAGTYFIKIDEFGNDGNVDYDLVLSIGLE
jgi:cysteine-rich repeat protein